MCEPSVRLMLHTGRTAQIRGNLWFDSGVNPSEALEKGTCRDCTGRSSRQETVQTPNPKGAAKAVAGMHNPLVPGSTPGGAHPQWLFLILQKYFLCGWSLLLPPGTRQSRQPLIFSLYRLFSSLIPKNPYFFGAQGQPWFCADLEPIYDSFCAPVGLRRAMTSDSRGTSNAFLSQLVTEIFF